MDLGAADMGVIGNYANLVAGKYRGCVRFQGEMYRSVGDATPLQRETIGRVGPAIRPFFAQARRPLCIELYLGSLRLQSNAIA
ncbi:hypothetical protein BJF91_10610 [Allorhizobium taibaishanense]|uniref:Uncharacterized protein n=1 Tax=Allorhizobium taibaishanense TaxID=887144 RepID=A0A1Q8ZYX8_9HYPH|nr:hypothetical protein BJF91_10610 [Allorhizobium taibaishanense]